jgi:hypothetical protein
LMFLRSRRIFDYKMHPGAFSNVLESDRGRSNALSQHNYTEHRSRKQYGQRRTHSSLVNLQLASIEASKANGITAAVRDSDAIG